MLPESTISSLAVHIVQQRHFRIRLPLVECPQMSPCFTEKKSRLRRQSVRHPLLIEQVKKEKKKEISQEPKVLSGQKDGFSVGASQMRGSDKLRLVLKRTHVLFCQAGSFPSQRINATCQKSPTCCQTSE